MSFLKGALILALLVSLSLMAGCFGKVYLFDFTVEQDLDREDGNWTSSIPDPAVTLNGDGLLTSGYWFAAPHFYTGDFKVTMRFSLNVWSTNTAFIELYLCSDVPWNNAD